MTERIRGSRRSRGHRSLYDQLPESIDIVRRWLSREYGYRYRMTVVRPDVPWLGPHFTIQRLQMTDTEKVKQRLVTLARRYGREWAQFNAPEDFWGWMAERIKDDLSDAWEEGRVAGQHNEHEFRPGRKLANPYRTDEQQEGDEFLRSGAGALPSTAEAEYLGTRKEEE